MKRVLQIMTVLFLCLGIFSAFATYQKYQIFVQHKSENWPQQKLNLDFLEILQITSAKASTGQKNIKINDTPHPHNPIILGTYSYRKYLDFQSSTTITVILLMAAFTSFYVARKMDQSDATQAD